MGNHRNKKRKVNRILIVAVAAVLILLFSLLLVSAAAVGRFQGADTYESQDTGFFAELWSAIKTAFTGGGITGAAVTDPPNVDWVRQAGTANTDRHEVVLVDPTGIYVAGVDNEGSIASDAVLRKYDSAGNIIWARLFGTGTGSGFVDAFGLAADSTGVYVGGYVEGALPGKTGAGDYDAFVRKYDFNGNELWTDQFGTTGFDSVYRMSADSTGVYVSGEVGGDIDGAGPEAYQGGNDGFVRKYDSSGNIIWTRQFGTPVGDSANGISAQSGNVYVIAYTNGDLESPGSNQGSNDAVVRKYDSNGNAIWTRQYGTIANDFANEIFADSTGVYVSGVTSGSLSATNAGGSDIYVRKYDFNGNVVWTRQFGSSSNDFGGVVATSSSGVYVAGTADADLPGQTGTTSRDLFVRKYDFNGNELWTTPHFGTSSTDNIAGVSVDLTSIYIVGTTLGSFTGFTNAGSWDAFTIKLTEPAPTGVSPAIASVIQFGQAGKYTGGWEIFAAPTAVYVTAYTEGDLAGTGNGGSYDAVIRKYDKNFNVLWTKQFGGVNADYAYAIIEDSGSVYVVGETSGSLEGTNQGGQDAWVRKYDTNGNEIWIDQFGTGVNDYAFGLDVDSTGIYVAGQTAGDIAGTQGSWDAFVRKYDLNGNLVTGFGTSGTIQFGTSGTDSAIEIAVDSNGIYVVGQTTSSLPGTLTGRVNPGGWDTYVRKYNFDGTIAWTEQFGGATAGHKDIAQDIVADSAGNVYVSGLTTPTGGLADSDAFVRKYDSNGNLIWTRQFGTAVQDDAYKLDVDSTGIYVSGDTNGNLGGTNAGPSDSLVRKYDFDGNHVWTKQFGATTYDWAFGISVDSSGVYVIGETGGSLEGQPLVGVNDAYVVKLVEPVTTAVCGNGIVETGEDCDSPAPITAVCTDFGFDSGTVGCYPSTHSSKCQFDTSACTQTAANGEPVSITSGDDTASVSTTLTGYTSPATITMETIDQNIAALCASHTDTASCFEDIDADTINDCKWDTSVDPDQCLPLVDFGVCPDPECQFVNGGGPSGKRGWKCRDQLTGSKCGSGFDGTNYVLEDGVCASGDSCADGVTVRTQYSTQNDVCIGKFISCRTSNYLGLWKVDDGTASTEGGQSITMTFKYDPTNPLICGAAGDGCANEVANVNKLVIFQSLGSNPLGGFGTFSPTITNRDYTANTITISTTQFSFFGMVMSSCGDSICDVGEICAADCASETGLCTDGADNDQDSFTDCMDSVDCGSDPACAAVCGNSIVEPGEVCDTAFPPPGGTQCISCTSLKETSCIDGIDNDGDGLTDSADSDCVTTVCGDSFCDIAAGENDNTNPNFCFSDCYPTCGAASTCIGGDAANCDSYCNLNPSICPLDPDCGAAYCGNSVCDPSIGENDLNCPSDCTSTVCGNFACELGEACSQDCSSENAGGNNLCNDGVDNDQDGFADCNDSDCNPSEPVCVSVQYCGNGVCNPSIGENSATCPSDCIVAECPGSLLNSCSEADQAACSGSATAIGEQKYLCEWDGISCVASSNQCTGCPLLSACVSDGFCDQNCGVYPRCSVGATDPDCQPHQCTGTTVGQCTDLNGMGVLPENCKDYYSTSISCYFDSASNLCGNGASCFVCGNGVCEQVSGESNANCPSDCAAAVCGNGVCEASEICSADCLSETYCNDGMDNDQDLSVDCADTDCSQFPTCGIFCGDDFCSSGESCSADCSSETLSGGAAGCSDGVDNDQDGLTDINDPDCQNICGNNVCEPSVGESNANCAQDCQPVCGNGVIESGEICDTGISTFGITCNACTSVSENPSNCGLVMDGDRDGFVTTKDADCGGAEVRDDLCGNTITQYSTSRPDLTVSTLNGVTTYTLNQHLSCGGPSNALLIQGSNVVLDCNFNYIFGTSIGIWVRDGSSNVQIKNCNINSFGTGIWIDGAALNTAQLATSGVTVDNTMISMADRGIYINAANNINIQSNIGGASGEFSGSGGSIAGISIMPPSSFIDITGSSIANFRKGIFIDGIKFEGDPTIYRSNNINIIDTQISASSSPSPIAQRLETAIEATDVQNLLIDCNTRDTNPPLGCVPDGQCITQGQGSLCCSGYAGSVSGIGLTGCPIGEDLCGSVSTGKAIFQNQNLILNNPLNLGLGTAIELWGGKDITIQNCRIEDFNKAVFGQAINIEEQVSPGNFITTEFTAPENVNILNNFIRSHNSGGAQPQGNAIEFFNSVNAQIKNNEIVDKGIATCIRMGALGSGPKTQPNNVFPEDVLNFNRDLVIENNKCQVTTFDTTNPGQPVDIDSFSPGIVIDFMKNVIIRSNRVEGFSTGIFTDFGNNIIYDSNILNEVGTGIWIANMGGAFNGLGPGSGGAPGTVPATCFNNQLDTGEFCDTRLDQDPISINGVLPSGTTCDFCVRVREQDCSDGVDNDGNGFADENDPGCTDQRYKVINNQITENNGAGIRFFNAAGFVFNNVISDNNRQPFADPESYAIALETSDESFVVGNTIQNNINGIFAGPFFGPGAVDPTQNIHLKNNQIANNVKQPQGGSFTPSQVNVGILMSGDPSAPFNNVGTAKQNSITGNNVGVKLINGAERSVITGNTLQNNQFNIFLGLDTHDNIVVPNSFIGDRKINDEGTNNIACETSADLVTCSGGGLTRACSTSGFPGACTSAICTPGETRACSTTCGDGIETCNLDGTAFAGCDAAQPTTQLTQVGTTSFTVSTAISNDFTDANFDLIEGINLETGGIATDGATPGFNVWHFDATPLFGPFGVVTTNGFIGGLEQMTSGAINGDHAGKNLLFALNPSDFTPIDCASAQDSDFFNPPPGTEGPPAGIYPFLTGQQVFSICAADANDLSKRFELRFTVATQTSATFTIHKAQLTCPFVCNTGDTQTCVDASSLSCGAGIKTCSNNKFGPCSSKPEEVASTIATNVQVLESVLPNFEVNLAEGKNLETGLTAAANAPNVWHLDTVAFGCGEGNGPPCVGTLFGDNFATDFAGAPGDHTGHGLAFAFTPNTFAPIDCSAAADADFFIGGGDFPPGVYLILQPAPHSVCVKDLVTGEKFQLDITSASQTQATFDIKTTSLQCPVLSVCGNNAIETGEQCDDGNIADGDGCSSTCQNQCIDKDGDGFGVGTDLSLCTGSTTVADCNDNNAAVNPNAFENTDALCSDRLDNNCNAQVDCSDIATCSSTAPCQACFYINANSITLNCQGKKITTTATVGANAIHIANVQGVKIQNCVIENFPGEGIVLQNADGSEIRVTTLNNNNILIDTASDSSLISGIKKLGSSAVNNFGTNTQFDNDGDGIIDSQEGTGIAGAGCANTPELEIADVITDAASVFFGCGPSQRDIDGDTLTDKQEADGWDSPAIDLTNCQPITGQFIHFTSDPTKADADNDGLNDAAEKTGWTVTFTKKGKTTTYGVKSDPNDANRDLDGDTETDFKERTDGTNPNLKDTDCDGGFDTHDGFEAAKGLNATNDDTDNDGLPDGIEIDVWVASFGLVPSQATARFNLKEIIDNTLTFDTDNDGISDGDEITAFLQENGFTLEQLEAGQVPLEIITEAGQSAKDTDGDTVNDLEDNCDLVPGLVSRQGCNIGDDNLVELHTIDMAKTGACGTAGSCKSPLSNVEVRVFDRNNADFIATYGTSNPSGTVYNQVFENDVGRIARCTTNSLGKCIAGESAIGTYLVIAKYFDAQTGKTVYTGKPKGLEDFVDTNADGIKDLAFKDFQIIKTYKKDGTIQFSGGSKTVITGSFLEIVYPDVAIWDLGLTKYVYPFIFTSDSEWAVDVCAQVPTGYQIEGILDENGNLIANAGCTQTFVAGQTKVVAFSVLDVGSPEPELKVTIKTKHKSGKQQNVDVSVKGKRKGKDNMPEFKPKISNKNQNNQNRRR